MSLERGSERALTETGPPSFQQPFVEQTLGEAQRLFQQGGPSAYPGQTVANFTQNQIEGQQSQADAARNLLPQYQQQLQGLFESFQQPSQDSGVLNNAITAATNPLYRQLTESILPQLGTEAAGVGGFGGSRQSLGQGQAVRGTQEAAGDVGSRLAFDFYNQGENRRLQSAGLIPALNQGAQLPGQVLQGIGDTQQGFDQALIDDAKARYGYQANLPYQNLSNFAQYAALPFGSQQAVTRDYPDLSKAEAILGGTTGIANLITALNQAGITGGIGGLLGKIPGLGGIFGNED